MVDVASLVMASVWTFTLLGSLTSEPKIVRPSKCILCPAVSQQFTRISFIVLVGKGGSVSRSRTFSLILNLSSW